jgi:hypothetical protein
VIVAVAVAAALTVFFLVQRWSDDAESPPTTSSTEVPATEPPVDTTEPIDTDPVAVLSAPMPLESRVDAVVLWTGSELVIWGGVGLFGPVDQPVAVRNDGAALDLEAGTWRILPESPFPDAPDRLPESVGAPRGVVTDAGVVIVREGVTALWDPDDNSWRLMDPAPGEVGSLLSDGSEVFSALANARLDVVTGEWRSLPEPPVAVTDPVSAWTGDELVVVGSVRFSGPAAQAFNSATDSWRVLPELPPELGILGSGSVLSAGWDGERVLLINGGSNRVMAYDPVVDRWVELPRTDGRGIQFREVAVARASNLSLLFMSDAMMLLDDDLWRPVPYGWVEGDSIIGFGRFDAVRGPGTSTVLIPTIDPATDQVVVLAMDVLAVLAQRRIPVGPITVELPGRYAVSRVAQRDEVVRVTVDLELGLEACTVMAGSEDESLVFDPIGSEVTVDHDFDVRTWTRHELAQGWQYAGDEYGVSIWCADPAAAEALARSVRFG